MYFCISVVIVACAVIVGPVLAIAIYGVAIEWPYAAYSTYTVQYDYHDMIICAHGHIYIYIYI